MTKKEALEQARFIFTTGKLIQDRIFRIQASHLEAEGKNANLLLSPNEVEPSILPVKETRYFP